MNCAFGFFFLAIGASALQRPNLQQALRVYKSEKESVLPILSLSQPGSSRLGPNLRPGVFVLLLAIIFYSTSTLRANKEKQHVLRIKGILDGGMADQSAAFDFEERDIETGSQGCLSDQSAAADLEEQVIESGGHGCMADQIAATDVEDVEALKECREAGVESFPCQFVSPPQNIGDSPPVELPECLELIEVDVEADNEVVVDPVQAGDIVTLFQAREYTGRSAVVTKVEARHCNVIILDETLENRGEEWWPYFRDISVQSRTLRLGTRVIVSGIRGARTKHLNGLTGVISARKEQHPDFCSSRLVVCVVFDDVLAAGARSAVLQPRCLTSYSEAALHEVSNLQGIAATLLGSTE